MGRDWFKRKRAGSRFLVPKCQKVDLEEYRTKKKKKKEKRRRPENRLCLYMAEEKSKISQNCSL